MPRIFLFFFGNSDSFKVTETTTQEEKQRTNKGTRPKTKQNQGGPQARMTKNTRETSVGDRESPHSKNIQIKRRFEI